METVLFLLIQLRFTHQRNGTLFLFIPYFLIPFIRDCALLLKILIYTVIFKIYKNQGKILRSQNSASFCEKKLKIAFSITMSNNNYWKEHIQSLAK